MARHLNIPIFIPHLGCPNACVFCNQRSISGQTDFDEGRVPDLLASCMATVGAEDEVEIAFFGGSFTGIDRALMIRLLEMTRPYTESGRVSAVRLSTRPDYIDEDILQILRRYAVKTVELGIQSTDDTVLSVCRRGHTAEDSRRACLAVKTAGFSLVGQMMVGLPGASPENEKKTAEDMVSFGADAVRVYPTVVFRGTELARMAEEGTYVPLSQEEAVERTASVLEIFALHGIPCIRVGLCASENLADPFCVAGGACQSAIGEMAMSRVYLRRMLCGLKNRTVSGRRLTLTVGAGEVSKAAGHRGENKKALQALFSPAKLSFREKKALAPYTVEIEITD